MENSLSERLQSLLEERRINQETLAEMVGVTQMAISNLVTGKVRKPRNLLDIANALGVDPNWLLYGTEPNNVVIGSAGIVGNNNTLSGSSIIMTNDKKAHRLPPKHRHNSMPAGLVYPAAFSAMSAPFLAVVPVETVSSSLSFFVAEDNAMSPTIEQGDVVFFEQEAQQFGGNGIYLLNYLGSVSILRIQRLLNGGYRVFDDSGMQMVELSDEQFAKFELMGRVTAVWQVKKKM